MASLIDPWLADRLVCPRDRQPLASTGAMLHCANGHRYPVVDGIPVMLVAEAPETIGIAAASLAAAERGDPAGLYVDTLSLSDAERRGILALATSGSAIDPVVAYLVAATNGLTYRHLIGSLDRYPIPRLPLPPGGGKTLLDVGCSWGRWTMAASASGYAAIGIDPSLGAVAAARRVASAQGLTARFVVGDARHLPFASEAIDVVYSYSVLQHLSYADAALAIREAGRVLAPGGLAKVQMPTRYGIRCLYHQMRRGFREPSGFEVRYWTHAQLSELFAPAIGPASFEVDCYFGIGLQPSDRPLMTTGLATVLAASEAVKALSATLTPLRRAADSVFVEARKDRIPHE